MRALIVILFAIASVNATGQSPDREIGFGYLYLNPSGGMGKTIKHGHGVVMTFGLTPKEKPYTFGLNIGYGIYGRDQSRQLYTFDDGSTADMDIVVANTILTVMPYARWTVSTRTFIDPYIVAKAGYAGFRTSLNIYDPDDDDHCEPVETSILQKDGTMVASIGVGVRMDMSSIFRSMDKNRLYFETSAMMTQGGTVRYMNTDAPAAHQHDQDYVMASFLNTETQVTHKHHVGRVYQNRVQMTEISAGLVFNFH